MVNDSSNLLLKGLEEEVYTGTRDGTIVCRDDSPTGGQVEFRSGMVTPEAFRSLGAGLGVDVEVCEVDGSSLFCEIAVP